MQSRVPLGPGKFHVVVLVINVINKKIDKPVVTLGIPDMFDANQALKS